MEEGGEQVPELKSIVRVSVRAVVETTMHESDLAPASGAARRMREGAAAHRARQSGAKEMEISYRAETALAAVYEAKRLSLRVTGRADGIFLGMDGVQVIEEIKLGAQNAPLIPAHRAQAAMYGHMLCQKDALERVGLRVLYVDAQGGKMACYEEVCTSEALEQEFNALCAPVAAWEEKRLVRKAGRDTSLMKLSFPFDSYRAGQRKFAANVYVALRDQRRLFAQAPTGIGKTMAALYPALLALKEGHCGRVLFLTARTTGRRSAMEAMTRLSERGARVMTVEIAAKDKICPQESRDCRPEFCPFARGFYDRLPAALDDAAERSLLGREEIAALAQRHAVCPFELSLELAQLADVVIGDYNYVFDPVAAIDALMQAAGGAALLVDEAHQLAPRVQDAYSARLSLGELKEIRREAGRAFGRKAALYRAMTDAIDVLKALSREDVFTADAIAAPPQALHGAMTLVQQAAGEALSIGGGKPAMDAFSLACQYLLAESHFGAQYAVSCSGAEKQTCLELLCLSAAEEILSKTKRAKGTAFFSATLAPFEASKRLLGSAEGDACLNLPSPFDPAQLDARILPIDIRYAARERTAPDVAKAIVDHLHAHSGHTIVFFPSYAYMKRIGEILLGMDDLPESELLIETRGMAEEEKNALLRAFEDKDERVVLLAVLGGAFSEGVDLPGERLKNVIVVSTGIPQPDARMKRTQAYYDARGEDGFFMTMTLPGMVRVIQAAGRLIRTAEDTGSLLLIDSRFAWPKTRALLAGTLIGDALETK